MTDRELLALAAKAAGIDLIDWREEWTDFWGPAWRKTDHELWNPLTDDGDALRLAVKLRIDVQQFEKSEMVEAWRHPQQACGEDYGSDPYAATRRAITRCAAEIGRTM